MLEETAEPVGEEEEAQPAPKQQAKAAAKKQGRVAREEPATPVGEEEEVQPDPKPKAKAAPMHVLKQTLEKYLLAGCKSPFWCTIQKRVCIRAWCYRIEYQEGTRATGPNAIRIGVPNRDGTGFPHIHLIVWTDEDLVSSVICQHLRADLAEDDPCLNSAVLALQRSHTSSLPINDRTTFVARTKSSGELQRYSLQIKHTPEAKQQNVRAYFAGLCAARLGHQDVQIIRSSADVLAYSAAYIQYSTKSSTALDSSLLDRGTSGLRVASAMLKYMNPSAAQMAVTLQRSSLCIF